MIIIQWANMWKLEEFYPFFFKLAELPKSTQYITTAIIFNKLSKENLNFIIE